MYTQQCNFQYMAVYPIIRSTIWLLLHYSLPVSLSCTDSCYHQRLDSCFSSTCAERLKYFTITAPVSLLRASGIHLVGVQLLDSIVFLTPLWEFTVIFTLVGVCGTKASGLCVYMSYVFICVSVYDRQFKVGKKSLKPLKTSTSSQFSQYVF